MSHSHVVLVLMSIIVLTVGLFWIEESNDQSFCHSLFSVKKNYNNFTLSIL